VNEAPKASSEINNEIIDENTFNILIASFAIDDPETDSITISVTTEPLGLDSLLDISGTGFNSFFIYLNESFNYELSPEVSIAASFSDGEFTEVVEFDVQINNRNDPPVIELSNGSLLVEEVIGPAKGERFLGKIEVVDEDSLGNYEVSMNTATNVQFPTEIYIRNDSLLIVDSVLDYEQLKSFSIQLLIEDDFLGDLVTAFQTYDFELININEPPVVSFVGTSNSTVDENTVGIPVVTVQGFDPEGQSFSWSIPGSDFFTIDDQGIVTIDSALNYELASEVSYTVRITDIEGAFTDSTLTVLVRDVNDPVQNVRLDNNSVNENEITVVGEIIFDDEDISDTHQISLASASDFFNISGRTLETTEELDFEANDKYEITINIVESSGLNSNHTLSIEVMDQNDPPTGIELSSDEVNENENIGFTIGTLTTIDQDAEDNFQYSISSGDFVTIVEDLLQTSTILDYEINESFEVIIESSDKGGDSVSETFTILVVNDPEDDPLSINSNPEIVVFPNPTSRELHFKGIRELIRFEILDTTGKRVQQGFIDSNTVLALDHLNESNYILVLRYRNKLIRKKLVLLR
jgi:hypothetical protein